MNSIFIIIFIIVLLAAVVACPAAPSQTYPFTTELFWNVSGTAFFKAPSGAHIKVRYGVGWFGFDRQKQTLNGGDFRKLSVGMGSLGYARMQVKVSQTTDVTYDVYGDGVARSSPGIPF